MPSKNELLEVMYQHMGTSIDVGLVHVLLCMGSDKKGVYKELYKSLKQKGVGPGYKTLVYPIWVREIIRSRFQAPGGQYDNQYQGTETAYIVTNEDLAGKWPAVNGCDFCG